MRSRLALVLAISTWLLPLLAPAQSSKWEKEIGAMETRLRQAPPGPGAVVLFGSSSFRMWTNAAAMFPGHRIVNLGFGGSTFSDLGDYFVRLVAPLSPRVVLVYGGDNDLAGGKSPAQVEADFRVLIGRARAALPGTRFGILAVKPSPVRSQLLPAQADTNARLRRYARWHRGVDFVDVATPLMDGAGLPGAKYFREDRLHLNGEGYATWRPVVGAYLDRWDR